MSSGSNSSLSPCFATPFRPPVDVTPERWQLHENKLSQGGSRLDLHPLARRNSILAQLPTSDLVSLLSKAELVSLRLKDVMAENGVAVRFCYFPMDCVATLVSSMEDGRSVEVGMVGKEGMIGARVLLGGKTATSLTIVQIPGRAIKIAATTVCELFGRSGEFQSGSLDYIRTLLDQVSQSAACNRTHLLGQRLCRWILNLHDRIDSDSLEITHEAIAQMHGANRPDVSRALSSLKEKHVLDVQRGKIIVQDRGGLEALACECYSAIHSIGPGRLGAVGELPLRNKQSNATWSRQT